MKAHKRIRKMEHVHDEDRLHGESSYQNVEDRQNLRQSEKHNTHNFKREDLGFTNRDTRGYDRQHKSKY